MTETITISIQDESGAYLNRYSVDLSGLVGRPQAEGMYGEIIQELSVEERKEALLQELFDSVSNAADDLKFQAEWRPLGEAK